MTPKSWRMPANFERTYPPAPGPTWQSTQRMVGWGRPRSGCWRVAGLAAEGYGLRVFVGAVAAEGAHEEEDEGEQEEGDEFATTARVVEIQDGIAPDLLRLHTVPAAALPDHADKGDHQAEHHHRGKEDVCEN